MESPQGHAQIEPSFFDTKIIRGIQLGSEFTETYRKIAEEAAHLSGAKNAAVLFLHEDQEVGFETGATFGKLELADPLEVRTALKAKTFEKNLDQLTYHELNQQVFVDIICHGATVGYVGLDTTITEKNILERLYVLAHHASVTFKRSQIDATYQHFQNRLQVINEVNQLVDTSSGSKRISKILARECAFRFGADIALIMLINAEKKQMEIVGLYGCLPSDTPALLPVENSTFLGDENFKELDNEELEKIPEFIFLSRLDIVSASLCRLEQKGEYHGLTLIGYRSQNSLTSNDRLRFEEFCSAAAVVVANVKTQDHLTAYSKHLEELVELRTAELGVQTKRAEKAIQAKSQFLANMSHELRTPLTAILGYTNVLLTGLFGELNPRQTNALSAVEQSSEQLKSLINDILNLARVESGAEIPDQSDIAVKTIITDALNKMQEVAQTKAIDLGLSSSSLANEISILVDPLHVDHILANLLSNAIKYTPQGGRVWITTESFADKTKILIHDTGTGISPEKLEDIFTRLDVGSGKYDRKNQGTGLGLNLSKRLAELNGGIIGAESVEGKGSTFWVMFPTSRSGKTELSELNPSEACRLDGLTAVVIDDSVEMCEVLKHILVGAGASVRTASNVRNGLELINENIPDIILTDIAMPGESGLVLIDAVRNKSSSEISKLPIIALSASAFTNDRKAVISAGASLFMPKPFDPVEIIQSVRKLTLSMALQGH